MKKGKFKSRSLLYRDKGTPLPAWLVFDLPTLLKKMKQKRCWMLGDINMMILFKTPNKRIVLAIFNEETGIESFQSGDSITLRFIKGKQKFYSLKDPMPLDKGQFMSLRENIKYTLTMKEETVVIMTILSASLKLSAN